MSNPLLPVSLVNAIAAIPGLEYVEARSTLRFLSSADLAAFKSYLGIAGEGGGGTIATPQIYYVASNGNDTTGDGTLGSPYLTGQKAYDIGVASAVKFVVRFGVGAFTIDTGGATFSTLCRALIGVGMGFNSSTAPTKVTLTLSTANVSSGSAGSAGGIANLDLWHLNCMIVANGGNTSDEDFGANGGTAGTINLYGDAFLGVQANGGSSPNGVAGTGGGLILKGISISSDGIECQGGASPGSGTPGSPGSVTAWKCDFSSWGASNTLGTYSESIFCGGCFVNPLATSNGFFTDMGGNSFPLA